MLISLVFGPPRRPQAPRRGMAEAVRPSPDNAGRGGEPALTRATLRDVGLSREHQDYASAGNGADSSTRRLHARAERLAAGLPE
jgi:transcription initiation factor TFIID subunit TAF12